MDEKQFWGRDRFEDDRPDETALPPEPETRAEMRMDDEGGIMLPVPAKLPDTNPKSQYGVKKPPLFSCVPATALIIEGQVMKLGQDKYGPFNWREKSVSAEVYMDALARHIMLWNAGEDNDDESLVSHLGHARACLGILIDAIENKCLIDDRPKDEATIRLIKELTRKD